MNAATETSESFVAPATAPRPVRPFYWSVMRELWEHRSLTIVPLVPRNATGKAQYPAAKELALAARAVDA